MQKVLEKVNIKSVMKAVDTEDDESYSHEGVQGILVAKDEGLVSDKAYHEVRMGLPEKV